MEGNEEENTKSQEEEDDEKEEPVGKYKFSWDYDVTTGLFNS